MKVAEYRYELLMLLIIFQNNSNKNNFKTIKYKIHYILNIMIAWSTRK